MSDNPNLVQLCYSIATPRIVKVIGIYFEELSLTLLCVLVWWWPRRHEYSFRFTFEHKMFKRCSIIYLKKTRLKNYVSLLLLFPYWILGNLAQYLVTFYSIIWFWPDYFGTEFKLKVNAGYFVICKFPKWSIFIILWKVEWVSSLIFTYPIKTW